MASGWCVATRVVSCCLSLVELLCETRGEVGEIVNVDSDELS